MTMIALRRPPTGARGALQHRHERTHHRRRKNAPHKHSLPGRETHRDAMIDGP